MDEQFKQFVFEYLDELRESGVVNMFGAGTYVMEEYDLTKQEAREYVTDWIRTFSERHKEG